MKPPPFSYADPRTLDEALGLLAEAGEDALVLAGGQSLMPLLNMRLAYPRLLVDINRVAELHSLDIDGDGVRVGATVRQRELERAGGLEAANPLLSEAIPLVGHFPIRTRGTVCGSLAHADPAAELPAVATALDARLTLASRTASRILAANDFFVSYLTTAREADELLTEVRFPPWNRGDGWAILETTRRHGDFALAGVVARLTVRDGMCQDVALVPFGTSARPSRATAVEELLRGEPITEVTIERAVHSMRSTLEPDGDIHASSEYRAYVAGTLTGRALRLALDRASVA